jgi:hypothetical protein
MLMLGVAQLMSWNEPKNAQVTIFAFSSKTTYPAMEVRITKTYERPQKDEPQDTLLPMFLVPTQQVVQAKEHALHLLAYRILANDCQI